MINSSASKLGWCFQMLELMFILIFASQSHYKLCKNMGENGGKWNKMLIVGDFSGSGHHDECHDAWRPARHDMLCEKLLSPYPMTGVSMTDGLPIMDFIHSLFFPFKVVTICPYWGMKGITPGLHVMTI